MLSWRFQQTIPRKPNRAAPRSVPITIPAFWPPLRPDEPPWPAAAGSGSGTFGLGGGGKEIGLGIGAGGGELGEGTGAGVGELGDGTGAGVGELGDGTGAGVGEGGRVLGAGEGEFGDGVGTGWASKQCNKFVNKTTNSKRFKNPLLIILAIMFVKQNTVCMKVNIILCVLKGDH